MRVKILRRGMLRLQTQLHGRRRRQPVNLVTQATHRANEVCAQFAPQVVDMHLHRLTACFMPMHAAGVLQGLARDRLAAMRQQGPKEAELGSGHGHFGAAKPHRHVGEPQANAPVVNLRLGWL